MRGNLCWTMVRYMLYYVFLSNIYIIPWHVLACRVGISDNSTVILKNSITTASIRFSRSLLFVLYLLFAADICIYTVIAVPTVDLHFALRYQKAADIGKLLHVPPWRDVS